MQQTSSVADFSPPSQSSTLAVAKTEKPVSLIRAYRLFWITFIVFFASTGAGKLWDRVWHLTYRFDSFWSLPHLFVFLMTMVCGLLVATIAFTPGLRGWFGPAIRMPVIRTEFAGSLVILGGGLIALTITILLDNFWHTAFGLDETQWSVPHCMLGWSWLTIILGFVAARIAFSPYYPITWLTRMVMALLILEFLCPAILGPFYLNYSPDLLNALKNTPIVKTEPSAQHMYHIYLVFGLTRQTSPLFIPIVALFVGMAMAMLRGIDRRARIFLLAPLFWSLTLMARDLYTIHFLHYDGAKNVSDVLRAALHEPSLWIPIPIFVAVVAFSFLRCSSLREDRIYALCGILFGVCAFGIWHTSLWMLLLAIPAGFTMMVGAATGSWLYRLIEKPTLAGLMRFLLSTCAQIPALLGVIDLVLRKIA